MEKEISIKVYRPDKTFLKDWPNAQFVQFTKELNAGIGECILELGEKFDYQGGELAEGNEVDILISDNDEKNKLIYSGYISMYEPWAKNGQEGITVHILGHYTKLDLDILKDDDQTTLYTEATAGLTTVQGDLEPADVGLIFRTVIDRYRAETVNPKIIGSAANIQETTTDVEYIFEQKTYREAIDKLLEMSPAGWNWYIDEEGVITFGPKPTTATHRFVFGKHFTAFKIERSMEKIRNALLFWNGELGGTQIYKLYEDSVSIAQYGRRMEKYYDWSIGDEATADKIGARFLEECGNPEIKVECEILDDNYDPVNGYDIESIQPGHTCTFVGFDDQLSDVFNENMLIKSVEYHLEKVVLTIEVQKSGMVDWQKSVQKQVDESYSKDAPETYTV